MINPIFGTLYRCQEMFPSCHLSIFIFIAMFRDVNNGAILKTIPVFVSVDPYDIWNSEH